jgi:hypothetical protein
MKEVYGEIVEAWGFSNLHLLHFLIHFFNSNWPQKGFIIICIDDGRVKERSLGDLEGVTNSFQSLEKVWPGG